MAFNKDTDWVGFDMECSYGCNSKAKFIYKNGKYCCSERFYLCPEMRKRASKRQEGENNSFYGRAHTEITKLEYSKQRKGSSNSFYGKTHNEATKLKLSISHTGKLTGQNNPNYGKPRNQEVRNKIKTTRIIKGLSSGKNNPRYIDGRSSKNRKGEMSTTRYKEWRSAVFTRDDYTCQMCLKRGGNLEADHILPWAYFIETRYDIDNGRTLCVECHKTTFKELKKYRNK